MPGGKGPTVTRECDVCKIFYEASIRRLMRNWDRCCSKSCANVIRKHRSAKQPRIKEKYTALHTKASPFKMHIRRLANYLCQRCGKNEMDNGRALDIHRIIPDRLGGEYTLDNVRALCRSCHAIEDRESER